MTLSTKLSSLFIILLLIFQVTSKSSAGHPDPVEGQQIFQSECSLCHAVGSEVLGPDLAAVTERRDEDWLISFIRNSQAMIREGDEQAVEIFEEYNRMVMPAVDFSDDEIRSVLAYIEEETEAMREIVAEETAENGSKAAPAEADQDVFGVSYDTVTVLLSILLALLIVLLLVLIRVHVSVRRMLWDKMHPGEPRPENWITVQNREFIAPLIGFFRLLNPTFAVLGGVLVVTIVVIVILYDTAPYVGSMEGYTPEQPIPFDHQLHAGTHEIDCQYCHTGVEFGKNANMPSLNICMNCHSGIRGNDSPDIQKVVDAYQNDEPIEWIRRHSLADHVYFSHAQHVVAGNIECQTCHGPVEETPRLGQVQNMTMGWCIDCHRETEVDLSNNYYHESFDFHKDHESLTVSQIGGIECSKCHY